MLDKTFDPAAMEQRQSARWREADAFANDAASDRTPFCIMMPPPNVTGSLHIGHALNHSVQDVLTRFWRMRGRDALWQPGTDHAGIATQMVVERNLAELGKTRHDLGREGFVKQVWDWKGQSGGMIVHQLERLGTSPNWARERFTMDEGLSAAVRKVFVRLYKDGLIYRDKRLVNWDPKLHTAISDLEVEQRPTKSKLWHIRYPIAGQAGRFITVATTRPETMLGDSGVAVHPDDERYADLVGQHAVLPLVGREIPIVADEYADPEKGSGAVKITPAHDFNDFEVGRRHGLAMINVLDRDARLNEAVPERFQGRDRYDVREAVLAELEEQGLLAEIEDTENTVPYGDRSGVVIEPWLTDQWYVDAKTLAEPALEAVRDGRTQFVPANWAKTYFEWLENIQPWCISRQLWWGHRIPAWFGPDGHIFVEETEAEALAAAKAHYGADTALRQDEDVLDTWFSSALWPFSTLGWPEQTPELARYYPTDVLVTGFDIIFFWVARMMMMGLYFMGEVPFRTVYMHALVRDAKGQKMSKSKGNVMDPLALVDRYGADALRFTLMAMLAQGRDIKLSEQRVEGYRNFGTKLWNAARFCQMNGATRDPGFEPAAVKLTLNRWVVAGFAATAAETGRAIEDYRFNDAAASIYRFVWNEFCDWYLEFAKPVLQGEDGAGKAEIQATIAWVLDGILHILHPFMPFLTEELNQQLGYGSDGLLILADWPAPPVLDAGPAGQEIDWAIRAITAIRSLRADMNVPAGAKIPLLLSGASAETASRLERQREAIERLARLDSVTLTDQPAPKGAVQAVLDEATLILPLAGIVDLAAERARLRKELARLDSEIARIDKKLGNPGFMAKAPDEVVEEQREKRADYATQKAKLDQALAAVESA